MTVSLLHEVTSQMAYDEIDDVGAFTYATHHPMKPHRMRITHDLISAYGMLDKMHILVRIYYHLIHHTSPSNVET